jgi:energy-coupling factor transporter ATP-binding protein EcfA2/energy-coupling factor transporter transmembrane protein EcfT
MRPEFRGGVRVSNLTWTPFASSKPLLNHLSFTIEPGERVLLVGPSGSGKSTLLRAIAGVLQTTEFGELSGELVADGAGLLLQDPNDTLVAPTILREVAFGPENSGYQADGLAHLVSASLDSVNIDKPLQHSSTDLSGGEMQRVALAGVLAMQPSLLLLDEPTSMLDQVAARAVREAVAEQLANHAQTLIVVEHRFDEWLPIVDRLMVLNHNGQLIFDGEPGKILNDHRAELLQLGVWVPGFDAPKPTKVKLQVGDFSRGAITAFTGNSGAGKTTELNRLMRLDPNASTILTGLGFVPQQPELTILGSTVFESAHFTARLASPMLGVSTDQAEGQTRRLLDALGLGSLEQQNPYEISGGEQRRLALATALAHSPMSLYLDEPTVGLDRSAWASAVGVILAARDMGVKVFLATHDEALLALADEIIEIEPKPTVAKLKRKPSFSGLMILIAPLLLLLGSMAIREVKAGLVSLASLGVAWLLLRALGARFSSPKALIAPVLGVISIGLTNWYLSSGLSVESGITAALRVSFFVFPGVFLATQLSPYRLGDQLAQTLKLPARPIVAAMVALERVIIFKNLWGQLRFIHQIRGVSAGTNPFAKIKSALGVTFGLLIQAIRGAGTTAVAMEARGFSRPPVSGSRTWAEKPKYERLDLILLLITVAVSTVPLLVH